MATHSSVLAWRIPGTGEPGGLPSVGSHRVGHDWSDLVVVAVTMQNSMEVFKKPEANTGSAFSLQSFHPERNHHSKWHRLLSAPCSTVYIDWDTEASTMPIISCMEKEDVAYTYILYIHTHILDWWAIIVNKYWFSILFNCAIVSVNFGNINTILKFPLPFLILWSFSNMQYYFLINLLNK